ncbi:Dockerin type 1 protein [Stanieria cyanosphaera PCC 7437]|uniref:Dockerin type 1 protein n=1 Tax=Stanieria cyanosphaera (strain ATCC 29371 / PCC 7437) TaxID=111780 RepID=K9XWI0_STAC7|nr:TetR/AcrR family transcriptional regulator [Stanieria cyanosphaera]AFZ36888.1 Dockerin type 1 protein [Stanieria cyanosphaera PCC 7437]
MKIKFDYRFDTEGFFNNAQKKAALEKAGAIWSSLLKDDFETIPVGVEFTITNPTKGNSEKIVLTQEIDDLLIFVGTNNFGNQSKQLTTVGSLGEAKVDGFDLQGDIFQRRISNNFRGKGAVSNFEPWAGIVTFNNTIDWDFSFNNPNTQKIDFISVALHEIGHILGFGTSAIFNKIGGDGKFDGVNALAVNKGNPIPLESDLAHVKEGFNQNTVLLDPFNNRGRNLPTPIDLALLADIGYQIEGFTTQGTTPSLATNGSETIFGSIIADKWSGLGGNDTIQGNAGNDTLFGGDGNDLIFGEVGEDSLFGEKGNDQLQGGVGNDSLSGGDGNDFLFGQDGNDTLSGDHGDDELQGGAQQDHIRGNAGNDNLFGDDGNDTLFGNEGNDYLSGGNGNDILIGGEGDDALDGKSGSDRFKFDLKSGKDTINDFTVAEDIIAISSDFGFNTPEEILKAITKTIPTTNGGFYSELVLSSGNVINIYHNAALKAANFEINRPLRVSAFNYNNSGFVVKFNQAIDLKSLNLYDGQDSTKDLPDLSLVSNTTGKTIKGSLIWNNKNNTLTFVKTGGILTPDDYTLTLASRADSFINLQKEWLDGNLDGQSGGNVVQKFKVANQNKRVLSLADFSRAPGHPIELSGTNPNQGWAVSLDNGSAITQVDFTLTYNADILGVTDLLVNPDLPDNWQIISKNLSNPGKASISIEGTTPLTKGEVDLVFLKAHIKPTAVYGKSSLLELTSVSLNHDKVDVIGDSAVAQVAYLGDSSGNKTYSGLDATLISRLAVGLDTGLDAYPLTDPNAIVDINRDGVISALDASLVAQHANGRTVDLIA